MHSEKSHRRISSANTLNPHIYVSPKEGSIIYILFIQWDYD